MPSDARYARLSARIGVCVTIAGIRVVPRVIARPFFGDEFFCVKNLVKEQERKRSDERKAAEHQG